MNEKIRELAKQSGLLVGEEYLPRYCGQFEDINEFAELLIKECISIVEPTSHHIAYPKNYLGGLDGIYQLEYKIKEIKRHFGIE